MKIFFKSSFNLARRDCTLFWSRTVLFLYAFSFITCAKYSDKYSMLNKITNNISINSAYISLKIINKYNEQVYILTLQNEQLYTFISEVYKIKSVSEYQSIVIKSIEEDIPIVIDQNYFNSINDDIVNEQQLRSFPSDDKILIGRYFENRKLKGPVPKKEFILLCYRLLQDGKYLKPDDETGILVLNGIGLYR